MNPVHAVSLLKKKKKRNKKYSFFKRDFRSFKSMYEVQCS